MFKRSDCRLYGVTQPAPDLAAQVAAAIAGGITMLQIREKHAETAQLIALARPILAQCRAAGIPCIINDNVEAAFELGADGAHVGQNDMSLVEARRILGDKAILGTSAHTPEEARIAQAEGADYIGCGAVFGSKTKQDATPLSSKMLLEIRHAVQIPIVAIGGITLENVSQLSGSRIDGIAVVSALFGQADVLDAARKLRWIVDTQIVEQEDAV